MTKGGGKDRSAMFCQFVRPHPLLGSSLRTRRQATYDVINRYVCSSIKFYEPSAAPLIFQAPGTSLL